MKPISCIFFALFMACPYLPHAQFKQVLIAKDPQAKELSIAINPGNAKEIVAGSNAGLSFSDDSGATWRKIGLSCRKSEKYHNPIALWHINKTMAYTYLKNSDTCIFEANFCRDFTARRGKMIERRFIYLDPKLRVLHATWTEISAGNKSDSYRMRKKDTSLVFYSQLRDNSKTWSQPVEVSVYSGDGSGGDSTLMGAVCCTGLNYEIYTAWAGPMGIMFRNMIADPGKNLQAEKIIAPLKNGWQYTIGKNIQSNGLPFMVCDQSNGEFRGRIYISWSDEKHGVHNKNVFLAYSDDRGETWTDPIVVTYRPNHKEQFMPYLTIDQSTGYIYILYYDQQNFAEGELTDLYLGQSKNGGLKFDYYKINATPIKPHPQLFFGNYMGLSVVNKIIRPVWMQMDEKKELNIYTALIDEDALTLYNKTQSEEIEIQKTFNYSDNIKIDFVLKNDAEVSAVITKPLEAGLEKIVLKNKKMQKGNNSFFVDTKKLDLQKGNYTLTLYCNNKNTFVWILGE